MFSVSISPNACMFLFFLPDFPCYLFFSLLATAAACTTIVRRVEALRAKFLQLLPLLSATAIFHAVTQSSSSNSSTTNDGNNLLNACQKLRVYLCLVVSLMFGLSFCPLATCTTHFQQLRRWLSCLFPSLFSFRAVAFPCFFLHSPWPVARAHLYFLFGSHCHRRTSLFSSRVCHFFRGGMIYFPQLYYSRHLSTFHNTLPKMRSTS